MTLFLDSGNMVEIARYFKMGVIRGVTTNPTILLKDGVKGGTEAIKSRSQEIAKFIAPLPLSVELTTNDRHEMIAEAQAYACWADNICVKVPIHGPAGETEYLEIVHVLETEMDIRVNVTAMMNSQQGYLAAMAGASYVSIFAGRINNMGYNACGEIARLRKLIDLFGMKAQIIAASTREVLNVAEWLEAGAHIVTVLPDILKGMIVHPYTKETVQMFLRDAAAAREMIATGDVTTKVAEMIPANKGHNGNGHNGNNGHW
jgi:transaldolase